MVALFVLLTIITFVIIDFFLQRSARRKKSTERAQQRAPALLDRFLIPKGFFISKTHAWIELLASGKTRIGIDDFVQKLVGTFDGISPLPVGSAVRRGDPLLVLRQGNRTLTVPSPLSGTIRELNEQVIANAAEINSDPYGSGWVAIIEPEQLEAELPSTSVASGAVQWLRGEVSRFKDFLAHQATRIEGAPAGLTLADGGVPIAGVLRFTDDKTWDGFTASFLGTPEHKEPRS